MNVQFLSTVILITAYLAQFTFGGKCIQRRYSHDTVVCVCNATYCDKLGPVRKLKLKTYEVFTSSRSGLRFARRNGEFQDKLETNSGILINVDVKQKAQTIIGWGGAFTDSAGMVIKTLEANVQNELMRSYFSKYGIEYNLCRVPIGASDFSDRYYSYDDLNNDANLTNFNLTKDDYDYKIPFIKEAMNLTNHTLKLIGSAWYPPLWMKTDENLNSLGYIKEEYYQTWADYHLRFLDAYKENGIKFWGLTSGNQPSIPYFTATVPSLAWLPTEQAKWIAQNLGPKIKSSEFADTKIIIFDDVQAFSLFYTLSGMFNKITQYFDGIGVHGYMPMLSSNLTAVAEIYKGKFILSTETSTGGASFKEKVLLGSWIRAEYYADDIVDNLNNQVAGWIEWNLALNLQGGPNFLHNFADASIIVNATAQEFLKQPTYYIMGHFSKFVPPSSVKVSTAYNSTLIQSLAFLRPDNGTVVIIYNKQTQNIPITLHDSRRGYIKFISKKKSISSILYW